MASSTFSFPTYPSTHAFSECRPYVPPKARNTQGDCAVVSICAPRQSSLEGFPDVNGGEHARDVAMAPFTHEARENSSEDDPVPFRAGIEPSHHGLPVDMATPADAATLEAAANCEGDEFVDIDELFPEEPGLPDVEGLFRHSKASNETRPVSSLDDWQDVSLSQQKPLEDKSHCNAEHLRSSDNHEGTLLWSNRLSLGSSRDHPITLDSDDESKLGKGLEDAQSLGTGPRSETRGRDRGYSGPRVLRRRTPPRLAIAPEFNRTMVQPAGRRQDGPMRREMDDQLPESWPRRPSQTATSSNSGCALCAEKPGSDGNNAGTRERCDQEASDFGGWRATGSDPLSAARSRVVDFQDRDRDSNARRSRSGEDRDDKTDDARQGHRLIKRKRSSSSGRDSVRRSRPRHLLVSPWPRDGNAQWRRGSRTLNMDVQPALFPPHGRKMKSPPSEARQVNINEARVEASPTDPTRVSILTGKDGLEIFIISTPARCLSDVSVKRWSEGLIATRLGRQGVAEALAQQESSPGFIVVVGQWRSCAPTAAEERSTRGRLVYDDSEEAMSDGETSSELDVDASDR